MSANFYTSDHHFWHKNIGRLCSRPIEDREQMADLMIERWNAVVRPEDTVVHLGDFSLSVSVIERVRPRLNGRIRLYAGNHDEVWLHHRRHSPHMVERYEATFDEVIPAGMGVETIHGVEVLVSHLPYHGDSRHDERYADLRPKDEGLPIICGHVHNAWARLYGGDGRVHRGQVNVGVDVWDFEPVPEDEVARLLGIIR